MPDQKLRAVLERISAAEADSPIQVSLTPRSHINGELEACFAKTVYAVSQRQVSATAFIGIFDSTMDMQQVRAKIAEAVRNSFYRDRVVEHPDFQSPPIGAPLWSGFIPT